MFLYTPLLQHNLSKEIQINLQWSNVMSYPGNRARHVTALVCDYSLSLSKLLQKVEFFETYIRVVTMATNDLKITFR